MFFCIRKLTFNELSSVGNDIWFDCVSSIGIKIIFSFDRLWFDCVVSSVYLIGDKHGEPDDDTDVIAVVVEVIVWPIPWCTRYWFWWAGDEANKREIVFG